MTDASFFLRDAETSLRMLVENASDILWINGPDGTCEWVSPSVQTALGYDPTTLVGTRTSIIHPDDRDAATLAIQKAMDRHETNQRAQVRVLTADGDTRWMDLSTDLWWTPENRLLRTVSSMRDITAQKLAEAALAESERRHRTLAENLTEVASRTTVDGTIQWVSPSVREVLGWEASDVVGRALWDLVHPDDYHTVREARRHLAEDGTCSMVVRLGTHSGDHRWIELRLTRIDDEGHQALVGTWTDVDAEHRAVEQLAAGEQQFRGAMQAASTGMCLVAPDGAFLAVNPALCQLLDRDEEALTSSTWQELTHPDDVAAVTAGLAATPECAPFEAEYRVLHADGSVRWVHDRAQTVCDAENRRFMDGVLMDVTDRRVAQDEMAWLAQHDVLTGLPNRRAFGERLAEEMTAAGHRRNLAAAVFDIDNFKAINDQHGHERGDAALIEVGRRLRIAFEGCGFVARTGGEEFIALLPNHNLAQAVVAAELARRAVEESPVAELAVCVSGGVSCLEAGDDLVGNADTALYRAKREGRNRVVAFP